MRSEIMERWQRHHSTSLHIMQVRLAMARVFNSARPSSKAGSDII